MSILEVFLIKCIKSKKLIFYYKTFNMSQNLFLKKFFVSLFLVIKNEN